MLEMVKISKRLPGTHSLELDYEQFTDAEVKFIVEKATPFYKSGNTDLSNSEELEYKIRHSKSRRLVITSIIRFWESEVRYENNIIENIISINEPFTGLTTRADGNYKNFTISRDETFAKLPSIKVTEKSNLVVGSKIEKDPWNRDKITAIRKITEEVIL